MLLGHGADELCAGYGRHRTLFKNKARCESQSRRCSAAGIIQSRCNTGQTLSAKSFFLHGRTQKITTLAHDICSWKTCSLWEEPELTDSCSACVRAGPA